MTLHEAADLLERMADGDGYAVVNNDKEIEALHLVADFIYKTVARVKEGS